MSSNSQTAMVLAAGLGKRMRSFASNVPKPMVEVANVSLVNRVLDRLDQAGINKVTVNLHHQADQLKEHIGQRTGGPDIAFSLESEELLDTGGGVKKALPLLGDEPFFVINSDALWTDGKNNTLTSMLQFWDDEKMDALLLVYPTKKIPNYQGQGDFCLDRANFLSRPDDGKIRPFVFTGIQIIRPELIADFSDGVFSLNEVYDRANENDRLFGLEHKGKWHHVGSGLEVAAAEKFYVKK